MITPPEASGPLCGPEYVALRQGGTPAPKARLQLGLSEPVAARSEQRVRRHGLLGGEGRPQFARHAAHVAAVRRAGGYPALAERGT